MSHPTKKQRLEDDDDKAVNDDVVLATAINLLASFGALSVDVLANIFAFLMVDDIMRNRRLNKKTSEAVRKTIAPPTNFRVGSVKRYNGMRVMTTELPNLQQVELGPLGWPHKYYDGEDPNTHWAAQTAKKCISFDLEIISNFRKLSVLDIHNADLNGRYPFLFNSFPLLEKLSINYCNYLKWVLEMLDGLPSLKELDCYRNSDMTGNIGSLRVLKDTLEKVRISRCRHVVGNFMDLADFPRLKKLDLEATAVTGDIRDIDENDYSSLEELLLPKGVYGTKGCKLQLISDAPDLARAVYLFNKKHQGISMLKLKDWYGELSQDSPDWYERRWDQDFNDPPLSIHFVLAGPRVGYQWANFHRDSPCEVNWLDPEPDIGSSDYARYIEELQGIKVLSYYRGFYEPPTEEEYEGLVQERGYRLM